MNTPSLSMDILGRALLGLYFLVPGVMKISGFSAMQAYMAQHGVSDTIFAGLLILAARGAPRAAVDALRSA